MNISYYEAWRKYVENDLRPGKDQWGMPTGYPGTISWVEKQGGRFVDWDRNIFPQGIATDDLSAAVVIGCVFPTHDYFRIFLNWAIDATSLALNDSRFKPTAAAGQSALGWQGKGIYPGNHGEVLAISSLSHALSNDCEIDRSALLISADEIAQSSLVGGKGAWDYIAQSQYLRSVRLALLAGDPTKARDQLQTAKREFRETLVHRNWLEWLTNIAVAADGKPFSANAAQDFQTTFDQFRNPAYRLPSNRSDGTNLAGNINMLRLELALIKRRYVLALPLEGNWHKALALISE